MKKQIPILFSCLSSILTTLPTDGARASDVIVRVDPSHPILTSQFEVGVTHTHDRWENGHAEAVARAKAALVSAGIRYHNLHLMGWGADNPNPDTGVFRWESLDRRLELIRSFDHAIPVITLCTAPGWMKRRGNDWDMRDRIADEHLADFAELVRRVAQRCPDVKHFHVWNEMKGYWSSALNNWDYPRYVDHYNAIYAALKSVRPEALVGGPYLTGLGGDGISDKEWDVLNHWIANKRGAEFICFDGWAYGYRSKATEEEMMAKTDALGRNAAAVGKAVSLPVWVSEYYAGRSDDPAFTAANHASSFHHSVLGKTAVVLLWNPQGSLFSETRDAPGGQATPLLEVVGHFNRHFGPGTTIVRAISSSPMLGALASSRRTLLINRRKAPVSVTVNGVSVLLGAYGVRLIDTPKAARAAN